MAPNEQVEQICDDLGIGHERALVAELLDVAAIGIVARYLAVVNDRPVEQRERMSPAPPAGRVGGEAPVRGPEPRPVIADAVELADVLGIADAFEGSHVLA